MSNEYIDAKKRKEKLRRMFSQSMCHLLWLEDKLLKPLCCQRSYQCEIGGKKYITYTSSSETKQLQNFNCFSHYNNDNYFLLVQWNITSNLTVFCCFIFLKNKPLEEL